MHSIVHPHGNVHSIVMIKYEKQIGNGNFGNAGMKVLVYFLCDNIRILTGSICIELVFYTCRISQAINLILFGDQKVHF